MRMQWAGIIIPPAMPITTPPEMGWAGKVLGGACLACAALSVPIAAREYDVRAIMAAMTSGDPSAKGAALEAYADTPAEALPDRGAAALAELAITSAAGAPNDGLRQLYLARAAGLITHLRAKRPDWAPTRLLSAQWAVGRGAGASPAAINDYARSYTAAPFLWNEARWRIAYGSAVWSALPPATRSAMIDEALWLTTYDGDRRREVEAALGDTPAGAVYQMRMGQMSHQM